MSGISCKGETCPHIDLEVFHKNVPPFTNRMLPRFEAALHALLLTMENKKFCLRNL